MLDPFALRVLAGVLFSIGAVSDIRSRRAPDWLWLTAGGLGIASLELEGPGVAGIVSVVLLVAIVTATATAAFAKGWIGGADAKAAMVLPIIYPRLPGRQVWNGVSSALLQGLEVLMLVCAVAGIVGLAWTLRLDDDDERGVPFLVPICAGVVTLFVA